MKYKPKLRRKQASWRLFLVKKSGATLGHWLYVYFMEALRQNPNHDTEMLTQ